MKTWTGRHDHALLAMTVQTGLRISEICSLTHEDIHLGIGPHVACTGEGRRQRITPLTRATMITMKDYLAERSARPGSALFCGPHGQRLSRDALVHRLAKHLTTAAATHAGLAAKDVTTHTLRHTAAMNLLAAGVDVSVIALWLGHSDTHSTDAYLGLEHPHHRHPPLKQVEHRLPIDPRGLHPSQGDPLLTQPVPESDQPGRRGR